MRDRTINQLNEINRRFYLRSAEEFHRTRRGPWRGFCRLLELARPALLHRDPLRVLDVGCGNGRFLRLLDFPDGSVEYVGVDFSPPLLLRARRLPRPARSKPSFLELDLLREPLDARLWSSRFDLIVVLGLLHHLPSHAFRRRLLQDCAGLLAPGGLLAFSCWDFRRAARLKRRRAAWSLAGGEAPIDESDLEMGDELLCFGRDPDALRYCHFADSAERRALVAATGLKPRAEFRADGREQDLNHYFLLERSWSGP